MLELLRRWAGDERYARSRLAFVTGDHTDPAVAIAWGLVRAAQAEHPGRFVLVDSDGSVDLAVAVAGDEPEILVRGGELSARRLVSAESPAETPERDEWGDPDGTVLIVGGTGHTGGLVARHLAARGMRNLLLVSRHGETAAGDLDADLAGHGARTTIVAADASDPAAVADLLAAVPAEHPLTAVVHAAAVPATGPVASLTAGELHEALRSVRAAEVLERGHPRARPRRLRRRSPRSPG